MAALERKFNITGMCVPELHYMVDISRQVAEIQKLVDAGAYFAVNRARQYGKTTTIAALERTLSEGYYVVSLDFQVLGSSAFLNENKFSLAFATCFLDEFSPSIQELPQRGREAAEQLRLETAKNDQSLELMRLFRLLQVICETAKKPMVLMIDEIDAASNNQVFLDFLAQLRNYYLKRAKNKTVTFWSVILAGVYDVKNLRRKLRSEEEHKENSPWNIAADFDVKMSFGQEEIAGMLLEYEADYHTGMDVRKISQLLYDYTSGYPFLVSKLCKLIAERTGSGGEPDWTRRGFLEAERILLSEKNTLFDSLIQKLGEYPELNKILEDCLLAGRSTVYNPYHRAVQMAQMFGFVKNQQGTVAIANRIFETLLYNYYLSEDELKGTRLYSASLLDKNQFVTAGHLNMKRILEKFTIHFHDLYGDQDQSFYEEDGRRYFLLYLRPIINGTGNYYIEAQTRNMERTDVIVDYCGEQFVIELKVWRGESYHNKGEEQLIEYLDSYHLQKGYMLIFNFNRSKETGVKEVIRDGKILVEAVV